MTLINLETLFLIFLIYSFGGWLIESTGDLIKKKKFVNRGFLIGPYCPIYGTGVVLITLLLSKYTDDIPVLFLLSMTLCGILEYLTSYIMEKVFKARWWDYSNMKFNINGRICLETLVLFGLAGVFILHYFNPVLMFVITKIPEIALHILSAILLILFLVDCIISLNVINSVKLIKVSVTNQVKDNTDEISSRVKEIIMEKSAPYRRLISAFPQAFADKLKESKEMIEKTAEKVKDNIQDVKENLQEVKYKTIDSIQNVKDKVSDNIQTVKNKTKNNIQEFKEKTTENMKELKSKTLFPTQLKDKETTKESTKNKFLKNYKNNTKLSLMDIYKKNK